MDIHHFLNNYLTPNKEFHGLVVSIDIVGSRQLSGTDYEKQKTKVSIKDLIESLLGNLPMAILSWRGDGGLLICDVREGFTDAIRICDLIVGLIPTVNRSRNLYNYLPNDYVHFRVVCNSGLINNTGDPETLTKSTIDDLFSEKKVGIIDHVVVSGKVYEDLPPLFKKRFTLLSNHDTPLDPCYALDFYSSITVIELIGESSERLINWTAEMASQGQYNELLIFGYTNETLYNYSVLNNPKIKMRILTRNWLVEGDEECEFNLRAFSSGKTKTTPVILKMPWAKSQTIKAIANQLMDKDNPTSNSKVDIRFYKDRPIFKGAILLGKKQGKRAGLIGLYSWLPKRKEGGSPYFGADRSFIQITDDGEAKSAFLDSLVSRFEELWSCGVSYEKMIELDSSYDVSHRANIEKIFTNDNRPYLIIYPGRSLNNRPLPLIAMEDFSATQTIKETLERLGKKVFTEVVVNEAYTSNIRDWGDHIIFLCHRSLNPREFPDINFEDSPYKLLNEEGEIPKIYLSDVGQSIISPIDSDPPQDRDFALVIKRSRSNGAKAFFIAGLHAIGTWGGAVFLTRPQTLGTLGPQVQKNDFAVVLDCEFSVPQRDIKAQILHGPKLI